MARSKWKLVFFSKSIWRKILFFYRKKRFCFRKVFYDRSSVIPNCLKSCVWRIHKGFWHRNLLINKLNIGYKFGEFSYTKKPFHFPVKKKK